MKLALANLKGGAGKTTSAVHLALGLSRSGRTLLLDADPQGSALSWSETAGDFPFPVAATPVKDLHKRAAQLSEGYVHVVIDTPPGEVAITRSALLAVDTVIVPISPSLLDIDRLRPTVELLADIEGFADPRVLVLLTRLRRGTRTAKAAREVLSELGLAVLATEVTLREGYATSFGLTPSDLGEYEDVLAELAGVVA